MQVFCPYPDLKQSVCCLDQRRLGNQIYREAKTLITGGWPNHPAARIWAGHKLALAQYCLWGLEELWNRGRYYPKWIEFFEQIKATAPAAGLPPIIGYAPFHAGHRAALLAKGWIDAAYAAAQHHTHDLLLWLPAKKEDWTTEHCEEVLEVLGEPQLADTWYSQFGWTETPEPDTKRAYIWRLP